MPAPWFFVFLKSSKLYSRLRTSGTFVRHNSSVLADLEHSFLFFVLVVTAVDDLFRCLWVVVAAVACFWEFFLHIF